MTRQVHQSGLIASILDRLLDDDPRAGDPRLDTLDLKDPVKLAGKLKAGADALSSYIREQMFPADLPALDRYDGSTPTPAEVLTALVDGLNRVIMGPFLYERQRFAGVKLAPETLRLIEDSRKTKNVSMLNRLIVDEAYPEEILQMRKPTAPSMTLRELKRAVSRDIEMLLNSRRELLEEPAPEYKEVNNSLLMYGLPDFTSYSLLSSQHRKLIRRAVEETLIKFEPRLKSVRVTLEPPQKFDAALHFRIDGLLRVDPAPEPVTFDAAWHLHTSAYTVRGEA